MKKRTKILLVSALVMAVSVTVPVLWAEKTASISVASNPLGCVSDVTFICHSSINEYCGYFLPNSETLCIFGNTVNSNLKAYKSFPDSGMMMMKRKK